MAKLEVIRIKNMIIEIIQNHTPPDYIPQWKSYPLIILINFVLLLQFLLLVYRIKSGSHDFKEIKGSKAKGFILQNQLQKLQELLLNKFRDIALNDFKMNF